MATIDDITRRATNQNSRPGRKPLLDVAKRREICEILAIGGTRTLAAEPTRQAKRPVSQIMVALRCVKSSRRLVSSSQSSVLSL